MNRRILATVKIIALVGIPVAFMVIPTSFFEITPTICIWRRITGHPCPACGSTRAISCVMHGHYRQAWEFNKLIILIFPLLVLLWIKYMRAAIRSLDRHTHNP